MNSSDKATMLGFIGVATAIMLGITIMFSMAKIYDTRKLEIITKSPDAAVLWCIERVGSTGSEPFCLK